MMHKVCLIVSVALSVVNIAAARPSNTSSTLCLSVGNSDVTVDGIISRGNCYGVFQDVVIKSCTGENEVHVGQVGELTVLELNSVENQTNAHVAQWHKDVSGLDIVWSGEKRVVVRSLANTELPRYTVILPVLAEPMPAFQVKSELGKRLVATKNSLVKDPLVDRILQDITAAQALVFLNYLTGLTSTIKTRNSIAPDGFVAARWIEDQYQAYGFDTVLEQFQTDYNPNVIATLKGTEEPDVIVVIGAHYDSRGPNRLSATDPAPGANDDGSGTSLLLQLARAIFMQGIEFKYTIVLGSWGGEEQGLVGSKAYAKKCKDRGDNIVAMLQADMIAFRRPTEGIQCGFPDRYADVLLTDLAISTMEMYTPEVEACYTSACCSDHQSFYEQGFAATQFFERCGPIIDDQYHQAGDVINRPGFDVEGTLVSLSKAMSAVALTIAQPTVGSSSK